MNGTRSVLLTEPVHEAGVRLLERRGCAVTVLGSTDEEQIRRAIRPCHGLLTRTARISARVLDAAPLLQVIAMHGVGVDGIDVDAAAARGVWVANAPGTNTVSVAEFAICQMLGLARRPMLYHQGLAAGNFDVRNEYRGFELEGRTLGVVGFGRIGALVARKAALGLGMRVLAYDPAVAPDTPPPHEQLRFAGTLAQVMREADIVTLHLPLVEATRGLISRDMLRLMKPTAYLVNTARGEIVDEAALIGALRGRWIAGAALDVFAGERPAADNPLLSMPNVLVSPHAAFSTVDAVERMAVTAAEGVLEALDGLRPKHAVNEPDFSRCGRKIS